MGRDKKRVYLEQIYKHYQQTSRRLKTQILDEFCAVCGYHRKYALTLVNRPLRMRRKSKTSKPRDRKTIYQASELLMALNNIWKASDYLCSKKLKATLPQSNMTS